MTDELTNRTAVPRVRSALFVPGDRSDFLAKADRRGADALIIDLEDAVASGWKADAQATTGEWLARRKTTSPACFVRVGAVASGRLHEELDAVVHPSLTGVVVPKVCSPDDVLTVAEALTSYEAKRGLAQGSICVWPLVETAQAVQCAYEIASSSPRIAYMGGATGEQGDLARSVGFEWSIEGSESLYIRSKVLVDVRAAGVPNPVTGMVTRLDVETVGGFARQSRQLGYMGMMVIHPAHVPVVNAAFAPTRDEIDDALRLIEMLRDAEAAGKACITFDGRMVDTAMARTAEAVLDAAGIVPAAVSDDVLASTQREQPEQGAPEHGST